ncbi:MAG: Uncharacterized protein XD67_0358 [Thermodesulfobacterium commune]|uniref:site-specific DNA-methyltransferase (adenine-specific) n=1 Tax=Thermodesulfobacterium commune TaxID=1741 RepID=A0A101FJU8_9BACT|nr:MAG: Uncharacterized protein XD67_0358 [Thermodesulfobacterium commune]HAA83221.1 hypothetical protein [Thermodesulfobacterium commune]
MDREQAKKLIINTFENPFAKDRFVYFLRNLLKSFEESTFVYQGNYIPDAFEKYVRTLERVGKYNYDGKEIDLLIVELKKETSLERARTMQRNFIAWYLKGRLTDAALVAFVSPTSEDWRFSLVKMDYRFEEKKVKEEITPARRWSFLVGKNEKSHTAQSRFLPLLENDDWKPALKDLEEAFNVEVVTQEFFDAYRYALHEVIIKNLKHENINEIPYEKKHSFAQQLLSRILFIYFLQKKGWLKWKNYEQDKSYLKNLWLKYKEKHCKKDKFYSIWLKSLFFGAFNKRFQFIHSELPDDIKESYSTMPFLNGGLFSENELDKIGFDVPDEVFEWLFEPDLWSSDKKKGFLEIFNFTIDEATPLDVEVAVDPEMLGKVYESLINEEERGSSGIFYTPRNEIDLMCRLSLVEYLHAKAGIDKQDLIDLIFNPPSISKYENIDNLKLIRRYLEEVKIVDPAVGSASFLVGMMSVLVELHSELTRKIENREENLFALKNRIILENLYGVDIKDWAVMVGELRLWLSLIIETDEKYMDIYTKPLLPNLSFKIRQGDSLVEEIGGVFINLRGNALKTLPKSIQQKIAELIDRKADYFSGKRSADLKEKYEIESLEMEIFREILQRRIDELTEKRNFKEKELNSLKGQKDLFEKDRSQEKELKNLKKK